MAPGSGPSRKYVHRLATMTSADAVTWGKFESEAPELAAFGRQRLDVGPAYLATIRLDGSPRLHPVNPKVHGEHLALYMFPSSPKGADLRHDGRFALHTTVDDVAGHGGEFLVRGRSRLVDDRDPLGAELADAGLPAREGYIRFELLVLGVLVGIYDGASNVPHIERWKST